MTRRQFLRGLVAMRTMTAGSVRRRRHTAGMLLPLSLQPDLPAGPGWLVQTSDPPPDSSSEVGTMGFRSALVDEILPFWERSVDVEQGGFITEIDIDGNRRPAGQKHIVMQTRMIYSFSLGYRLTSRPQYLEYATQGVEFFRHHFRDDQFGGWFSSTTRGGEPVDRQKWPYGQAFAAYALADYFRASGDRTALDQAAETYQLLRCYAWDHERGGISWQLQQDWSSADPAKHLDAMLHTMEAATSLLAATGDNRYLADLNEIIDTILHRAYDSQVGCVRGLFTPDWEPLTSRSGDLVDYGHIAETAWFISVVAAYTGNRVHLEASRSILSYVMRKAWDPVYGGIFSRGECDGEVTDDTKEWWMQGDMLGALSMAYRLTGDVLYLDWLGRQAAFIYDHQRDPRDGEWYYKVAPDGTILDGRKGFNGKAAYHVVQALYHADRNLAMLRDNGPTVPGAPDAPMEDFVL
jgi:mannose/cellobiose epimerase-like protein (N-acyl-D-glucosamine 2-epimerase family)